MDLLAGTALRFVLYVLTVGAVCGYYVYDRGQRKETPASSLWIALAVVTGPIGALAYQTRSKTNEE